MSFKDMYLLINQKSTRRCSGNHFFSQYFSQKKKLNFWMNVPFCKFYNLIVKTQQQWLNFNGKNAFECPLHLELYLKVQCMNGSETNFSRTAESQRLWQGAICHVCIFQFNKHWRQSQKQLQKYNIRDFITTLIFIGLFLAGQGGNTCPTWLPMLQKRKVLFFTLPPLIYYPVPNAQKGTDHSFF